MFDFVLTLLMIYVACVLSDNPSVTTKNGDIRGCTKDVDGMKLSFFQGIPYAKPPVLDRRFKPPEPADNWEGVKQTTDTKPACPQNLMKLAKMLGPNFKINETDEDCLYLNVFVPGTPATAKTNPLAVMVFIHGGGFQIASGNVWDVSRLSAYGNVVVVTMNYRLGVLGFLSTNDSAARGNWGLLDQQLALKWVKDNIEEFGGDASLVTIFGHSAGGYSVGLHIISPLSQGLFARGISLGGTIVSPFLLTTDPVMRVKPLAVMTKCMTKEQKENGDFQSDKVVECLRNVSVSELLKHDQMTPGAFTPVIDGHFITGEPVAVMKAFKYTPVTYIVGGTSEEGTHIANRIPDFYSSAVFNSSEFERHIQNIAYLALYKPVPKSALPALMKVMSAKYYPRKVESFEFKKAYLEALGDLMTAKIFKTGHVYSKKGTIYIFRFTHKPSTSKYPAWAGPGHLEELSFLFGYTLDNGTEKEKMLSRNFMQTWGRFARTGVPKFNNGTLTWTKLSYPQMNYFEIKQDMTSESEKNWWKTDLRRFWNKAIPEVAMLAKTSAAECKIGIKCYACTYRFSGNGQTDNECVRDPLKCNKIRQESCALPKMCAIKATYTNKFGRLSSLTRGCFSPAVSTLNKTTCTNVDDTGGANCYFQCVGELCNVRAGDLHVNYNPNVMTGLTSLPSLLLLSLLTTTYF